jgi:hypothetical protein
VPRNHASIQGRTLQSRRGVSSFPIGKGASGEVTAPHQAEFLQIGGILQMRSIRRFILLLGIIIAALALGAAPTAVAANPEGNHFVVSDSFTDNDFCGTGQTVDISFFSQGTEFLAPNQPVDYRNVGEGNVVYTNPLNGATVTDHFAGQFTDTLISGDPAGINTHERTFNGVIHSYRTDGGLLYLGAGYVVVHQVQNGDEPLSVEIVVVHGPHPDVESGFTIFCETIPSALGLS